MFKLMLVKHRMSAIRMINLRVAKNYRTLRCENGASDDEIAANVHPPGRDLTVEVASHNLHKRRTKRWSLTQVPKQFCVVPSRFSASTHTPGSDQIADVAIATANGDFDDEALTLTGREAIGGARISNLLGQAIGKPVRFASPDLESFRSALAEGHLPEWHIDALIELYTSVQQGRASHVSSVTPDIENVTGKRSRSLLEFAQDAFGRRAWRTEILAIRQEIIDKLSRFRKME